MLSSLSWKSLLPGVSVIGCRGCVGNLVGAALSNIYRASHRTSIDAEDRVWCEHLQVMPAAAHQSDLSAH
eukprot:763787-Hanusia_phi.AAC.1